MTFLCVGLGNPGNEYGRTRHNVGFMTINKIAHRYNFSSFAKKYKGEIATGTIAGHKIIAIKPQTFMNKSGECVSQVVNFYKIPPEKILVFYDELDLPTAKIRIKTGGGNGGHNGLRSLDSYMDKNYVRIRIGIGHPGDKLRVSGYVLSKFAPDEQQKIDILNTAIADYIDFLLNNNASEFMNKIALSTKKDI